MSLYIIAILFCQIAMSKADDTWRWIPYGSCRLCHTIDANRDIKFHLYTRKNPSASYILKLNNESDLANSPLHPEHQTVFYIHGFDQSVYSLSSNEIVKAHLKRNEYNMIVVDWCNLAASPWYNFAIANSIIVGEYVANFVKWLQNQKRIFISDLHVIGFSLGAHVAGFMGKKLAPHKVGRITGLDPAAVGFTGANISDRLDISDATFVDVIHVSTTKGGLGFRLPLGHVDFYPNKGLRQPGCENEHSSISCSHRRAWKYYAESVLNPQGFPASKCEIWEPILNNCTTNSDAFMGFGVDLNSRGIFTVTTNSKPPFATNFNEQIENNKEFSENSSAQILSTIFHNIIFISSFYLLKKANQFLYLNF